MTTTKPELKACPFCGSDGANVIGEEPYFYVACGNSDCYVSVGEIWDRDAMPEHSFFCKEVAIKAWNTRPDKCCGARGPEACMKEDRTGEECRLLTKATKQL